jgi:hypothetical protein
VESALGQHPGDKSLAIFVDVNLPPESEAPGLEARLWDDAKRIVDGLALDEEVPDPYSVLGLTNFGWHYAGRRDAVTGPSYRVVVGKNPTFPLKSMTAFEAVLASLSASGKVPVDD